MKSFSALFGVLLMAAAVRLAMAADATPAAADQHFDVHEYRVLGNTVLTARQIEGVLYPLLGDGKSMTDVEAARGALENAYHSLGYATVFVDVPPQEVSERIVRLRVTEGRIRERTIHGARYFSEGQILEQLPATRPGTVPRISDLQQQVNALNLQTQDRTVVPVLKSGAEPGTMDVALNVDDHLPLHGSLDLNNQYSSATAPLRLTGTLGYDNLFAALDSVDAMFTTSPQDTAEVQVLNANYSLRPLGPQNLRTTFSFTNSSSNVATIGTLGVLGDGQVYGGHISWPLVYQTGEVQNLNAGIDYKHFRNTINLAGTDSQAASSIIEPVAYANLSIGYSGLWQWVKTDGRLLRSVAADLTFVGGPRGVTNETLNFDNTRYLARGNYSYLRGDLSFTTVLPGSIQLQLRGAGQATQDPLVVYEQTSITGADAVRGYLEAEVLADDAVRGTVQLQSPPFSRHAFLFGDGFVFFDAGHAHFLAPLPGQPNDADLRSFGAGLDLLPGHSVTGTLTWAYPLTSGPDTRAHDSRLLFDVKGQF